MYIIECLPFSKSLNKESLTYFSSKLLPIGSLIKVPLRGKNISALVLKSQSVTEMKTEIKSASFSLKKISQNLPTNREKNLDPKPFLEKEFFESLKETAEHFIAPIGSLLSHIIPNLILENPNLILDISKNLKSDIPMSKMPFDTKNEVQVLQTEDEERFIHYRALIREEFAKKKSVFFCLPQNEDVRQAKERLERGIESFVCAFTGEMSKKEFRSEWKKFCNNKHPLLIIASARWLFLPRKDLGTIILDEENKNGWKVLSRPFFDLRFLAETFARQKKLRFILGDTVLRTETLHRFKENQIGQFERTKWRLNFDNQTQIADLKKDKNDKKEFKTLSLELKKLIENTVQKKSHIFIFAARKGLSTTVICRDCGEQVLCHNCASPTVLYKTHLNNIFKCHNCGETRNAAETCSHCQSWRLEAYGAGIDKIVEEIKNEIPEAKVFEIHKDITNTPLKIKKNISDFYENKGAVLIGTEMALPYLHKKITNSAISSFDTFFSIPDFRIKEKIFNIILRVRDLAKENFLIQTRNPEDKIIKDALSGNIAEFYEEEISDRKMLGYPPFGLFIKITVRGTKNFVTKEIEKLQKIFQDFNVTIFNSTQEKRGEQSAANAVLKLPNEPLTQNLLNILKSLPLHFEIKVDPDTLL